MGHQNNLFEDLYTLAMQVQTPALEGPCWFLGYSISVVIQFYEFDTNFTQVGAWEHVNIECEGNFHLVTPPKMYQKLRKGKNIFSSKPSFPSAML